METGKDAWLEKCIFSHLEQLKDRYYYNAWLGHKGDCDIYRSIHVYGTAPCTCGFLHDLNYFDYHLVEKLNPYYWDEKALQEGIKDEPNTKSIDWTQFGFEKCIPRIEQDDLDDWKLIEKVFGDYTQTLKVKYEEMQKRRTI